MNGLNDGMRNMNREGGMTGNCSDCGFKSYTAGIGSHSQDVRVCVCVCVCVCVLSSIFDLLLTAKCNLY